MHTYSYSYKNFCNQKLSRYFLGGFLTVSLLQLVSESASAAPLSGVSVVPLADASSSKSEGGLPLTSAIPLLPAVVLESTATAKILATEGAAAGGTPTHPNSTSASTLTPIAVIPKIVVTPTPDMPPLLSQGAVPINRVEVVGNTVLKPQELQLILDPLAGRTVTREDVQKAANAITELYLQQGFITSRAVVDEASLATGIARIQALEGSIEEIKIEGNRRILKSYILSRVRSGAKSPLNVNDLEAQLRFLRANPLFENVASTLKAGTQPGKSILTVKVTEARFLSLNFGIDNYIPPGIAPDRAFGAVTYNNLTGRGDQVSVAYAAGLNLANFNKSADLYSFTYRLPVNAMEGSVELQVNLQTNRITDPELAALGIEGKSEFYQLTFRQPLIRTLQQEFALSLGFSAQGGQTFLFNNLGFPFGFGPEPSGVSRTRVLRFGQDYLRRDQSGAWAVRSQFNFGLGIMDATTNPDPIPDGRFFSWTGQVQRVQRVGGERLLIMQGNLQFTPNSLLPSEQFVIGGVSTVRGYAQNARSGDNGYRFSVEARIPILKDRAAARSLQLSPFAEVGQVFNQARNPNLIPNPSLLGSVGLGLLWQPIPDLNIRLDYGVPLVSLNQPQRSLQDVGFNFSLSVGFRF